MSHTNGPWELDTYAEAGHEWHEIHGEIMPGRWGVVADTLNRDHLISDDEDIDNARLVKAAPCLLSTLRAIVDFEPDMESGVDLQTQTARFAKTAARRALAEVDTDKPTEARS